MQSTFVLCVLIVLLGAASAIVDVGDDNVIIRKPQTVEARQIEHGDDDHDHEEDHVEQNAHNANSTQAVFHNATETNSTPVVFHNNATDNITLAFEDEDYHTSEVPEVDDSGCQLRIRNELEKKCFIKFEDSVSRSLHIEAEAEQEKEVCCALEEYEKCCYRGYKATNCNTDKESLKETLKAARIFLGAITKNSCSAHRGRCSLSSAARTDRSSDVRVGLNQSLQVQRKLRGYP
ncbi:hypothetical protein JTE90_005532 [Oedothorax gibbosus]|uniref:Uncharacterized protein n=1 Tax=Oedothorax gibbosus TaxID=931172 RepID=A0AAV6VC08_9ARAC|nr:hypothetical protein JTE90_005532 [Oedothorax gibbosus]